MILDKRAASAIRLYLAKNKRTLGEARNLYQTKNISNRLYLKEQFPLWNLIYSRRNTFNIRK